MIIKDCYTLEEAQNFIDVLLEKAPIVYQCYFPLAIYGGFRRAELCGLTWDNSWFWRSSCQCQKDAELHIQTGLADRYSQNIKVRAELKASGWDICSFAQIAGFLCGRGNEAFWRMAKEWICLQDRRWVAAVTAGAAVVAETVLRAWNYEVCKYP